MARKRDKRRNSGQRKRKISEMIWEFAGDFLRMAETVEERQSLLNAVCSAWNMACNPAALEKALDQYMREYQRFNSNADQTELAGVRSNMEKLVQKKLEMFPGDHRQIVGAQLMREEDKDRIEVMSATVE
jgi:hypothetical protein